MRMSAVFHVPRWCWEGVGVVGKEVGVWGGRGYAWLLTWVIPEKERTRDFIRGRDFFFGKLMSGWFGEFSSI